MENRVINYPDELIQWDLSGQSMAAFCRDRKLSYQRFVYFVKRRRASVQTGFTEVITVPAENLGKPIEFYLPSGIKVVFPGDYPLDKLRAAIGC